MMQTEVEIDFRAIFESAPGLYLVLSPDLVILTASDAYLYATMTRREAILGRHLFDIFPDNPTDLNADGVSNLRSSLLFVLKNKVAHAMAVQKYDIRIEDGTFEDRYWSPVNKPVIDSKNEIRYIIHRVSDVTDFVHFQNDQAAKNEITDNPLSRLLEMEAELFNRSREIQKLNRELEQQVAERTYRLESINRDIADYKFALDESNIVAVTDHRGVIVHANDNFCKISKFTKNELIGSDHRIINSGHHPKDFIRDLWTTISKGNIWKGELKNRAKDGSIYWVDTTIVPFLNEHGKPYKYLAIRSDITARKMAEERIMEMNHDLESKVERRTLELTASLEREQAMSNMKSRFVSIASHEFRTPLSTILSSVSLISAYSREDQQEKRDKHIERIKSSVKNLTGILNDFLSVEKLEQGKVEVKPELIDICEMSANIIEEMNGMLKPGQRVIFSHKGTKEIWLDRKILNNILLNLLSNSIKYSGEHKEIEYSVEASYNLVTIKVKDYGIGIPEEEKANLFRQFFRAKNVETIQGTGLGLNIVKRYVELLSGTIDFVSQLSEGTTFTVRFPQNN